MSQALAMGVLTAVGVFAVLFSIGMGLLDLAIRRGRVDIAQRLEKRNGSNGNGNGHRYTGTENGHHGLADIHRRA